MIDTPGSNNSRKASHKCRFFDVLGYLRGGLILDVLGVIQIGIYDDMELLSELHDFVTKNKDIETVFV